MSIAIPKTLSILVLILLGLLLKRKLTSKGQLDGIKVLILSVALPATIFVALLKVQVKLELLAMPILALAFNLILFYSFKYLLPVFGMEGKSASSRTLLLLLPSLAPGLSCFPLILEYLGQEPLVLPELSNGINKMWLFCCHTRREAR